MDVVLVVYCYSTLVWVKDADSYCIFKWFYSNQVVVEGRNYVALRRTGRKVVGESSLVRGLYYGFFRYFYNFFLTGPDSEVRRFWCLLL